MVKVKQCIEIMRSIAPEEFTYEYDNVGLLVGSENDEVQKIMCCLDVTERVLDEAIEKEVQLLISHHPMIFTPLKRVTEDEATGRKIIKAIRHKIGIYAAHTNLDFVTDGINEYVSELLQLQNISVLDPYIDKAQGFGRVGTLKEPLKYDKLADRVRDLFSDRFVRIIGGQDKAIKTVAIINGAGGGDTSYIDMALKAGAECLITADVKHHVAIYAIDNNITIIEPQHFTMENCYIERLTERIKNKMKEVDSTVEVFRSRSETNIRI